MMARILCVDDDRAAASLKSQILARAGYDVTTCASANEAIEELARSNYDAVVTDWRLGEDSGRAIVEAAKATSSVPVVVVSGYVSEAFQAAKPLADVYLEKPVNPEELVEIIHALLA
jgi:DNA-binding response OmpR family regulator